MERKRSVSKTAALGCGGLIVLLVVLSLAGYAILRAIGGRRGQSALERLKASGAPTTWEEVIPAPVPDDQNAALPYEEAFALLAFTAPSREAIGKYLAAEKRAQRMPLEKKVERILSDNAEALAYLRQAAQRPKCRFDRDWSDPAALGDPMATSMPELLGLLKLSHLACAQAVWLVDRGDLDGALEFLSLPLRIVEHLEPDPMLTAQITRYRLLSFTLSPHALRQILSSTRPTANTCRSLERRLAGLELRQPLIKALETERVLGLEYLKRVRRHPPTRASLLPDRWRYGLRHQLLVLGYPVVARLDQATMLRFFDEEIALAGTSYREAQAKADFDLRRDDIPGYALATRGQVFPGPWEHPLSHGALFMHEVAAANVAMMRIGLMLAAYRTQFGHYPESLHELGKALEWEPPTDPFSGKRFVYRREGAGYLLYSVGWDLDDDGGKPQRRAQDPKTGELHVDGDILWRVER